MGKTYGKLPSQILGIQHNLLAYQFDLAVMTAGFNFEAESSKSGNKRGPLTTASLPKDDSQYASPVSLAGGSIRKVKIKEDGTW